MQNRILLVLMFAAMPLLTAAWADEARQPSADEIVERLKPAPDAPSGPRARSLPMPGGRGINVEGDRPAVTAPPSIDLEVNFEFNSAKLTTDAELTLDNLGKALQAPELQGSRFKVTGHTDAVGGDAYNLELSRQRAAAVRDYLVRRHSVDAQRLTVEGMGRRQLADPEHPDSAVNRRVQVTNLGS